VSLLLTKRIRQEEKRRFSVKKAALLASKSGTSRIEKGRFISDGFLFG